MTRCLALLVTALIVSSFASCRGTLSRAGFQTDHATFRTIADGSVTSGANTSISVAIEEPYGVVFQTSDGGFDHGIVLPIRQSARRELEKWMRDADGAQIEMTIDNVLVLRAPTTWIATDGVCIPSEPARSGVVVGPAGDAIAAAWN